MIVIRVGRAVPSVTLAADGVAVDTISVHTDPVDPTGPASIVLTLLRAGVPLTLLIDLADPAGPDSRAVLLDELLERDVRRDVAVRTAPPTDFIADQGVC